MLRKPTTWCVLMLLLAAGGSPAEQAMDLAETPRTVKVVTTKRLPDECLAPVEVTRIDDVRQAVPARGFMIEPGLRRINGRAILDTTRCWPLEKDQYIPPAADLEVEFEEGKVYYLAYDRNHPDVNRWQLVVWKVEDAPLLQANPDQTPILLEPGTVQ